MLDCGAVHWEKWTAIGTLVLAVVTAAATGVALLPIWAEHRRRSRLARNLRGRLLLHVMPLIHIFIGRAAPNSGAFGTDALSGNGAAMKELEAMQALYAQADVLNVLEQNLLLRVLANLRAASLETVHPEVNRTILALLKELHAELERHPKKFLQGRGEISTPPSPRRRPVRPGGAALDAGPAAVRVFLWSEAV